VDSAAVVEVVARKYRWHPNDGDVVRVPVSTRFRQAGAPSTTSEHDWGLPQEVESASTQAMWAILEAALGRELRQLQRRWAFPVQVLNHVHYWLVIGMHGFDGREQVSSPVDPHVITALQLKIASIALDVQLAELEKVFTDDIVRHDLRHQFKEPLRTVIDLFTDPERVYEALPHVVRLYDWLKAYDLIRDRLDDGKRVELTAVVSTCIELVKSRTKGGDAAHASKLPAPQALEHLARVLLNGSGGDAFTFPLVLLLCDIIHNAAVHGAFNVMICWNDDLAALEVTNDVSASAAQQLIEKLGKVNRSMSLDVDTELDGSGLSNIIASSRRLRISVIYSTTPSAHEGHRTITTRLYLRRFVQKGNRNEPTDIVRRRCL
jgi:hypothetical protein